MKYLDGKIKKEHHILSEFDKFLQQISLIPEIQKIIPGRISRQQKGTSEKRISFSYFTNSGLKYKLKKGATAQEIFVICDSQYKDVVRQKIQQMIDNDF